MSPPFVMQRKQTPRSSPTGRRRTTTDDLVRALRPRTQPRRAHTRACWLWAALACAGCGRIGIDLQIAATSGPTNNGGVVDGAREDAGQDASPVIVPVTDGGALQPDADNDAGVVEQTSEQVAAPTGVAVTTSAQVSTLAGTGSSGFVDGDVTLAQFRRPEGIAVNDAGAVFVADRVNRRVRMISAAGVVSTLAGAGVDGFVDGPGARALFAQPEAAVVDGLGNVLVADANNNAIRRIAPDGTVDTLAGTGVEGLVDGDAASAQFRSPEAVAMDAAGNVLVADTSNHVIRRISPQGVVETVAGTGSSDFVDGPADMAQLRSPEDLDVDSVGNIVVADAANHAIRRVSPDGMVETLAGTGLSGFADGPGPSAQFARPDGIAVDAADNILIADTFNHRIRLLTPTGDVVSIAGTGEIGMVDGPGAVAQFNEPSDVAVDGAGNLVVCEERNHALRRIVGGGPGRVGVTWDAMLDRDGAPVQRYRASATPTAEDLPARTCVAPNGGSACTLTGLESGAEYAVEVVAFDAEGTAGPPSPPVVVTAP